MMVGMLVAGIGLVLAGLLAIGYGISVKEFSFGNTLIFAGVIGVCTGAIMLGLWMAVRELKNIARRLGAGVPQPRGEAAVRPALPPGVSPNLPAMAVSCQSDQRRSGALSRQRHRRLSTGAAAWQDEAASRDRACDAPPEPRPPRPPPAAEAEAQPVVFLDVAERARAGTGAHQRAVAAGPAVGRRFAPSRPPCRR